MSVRSVFVSFALAFLCVAYTGLGQSEETASESSLIDILQSSKPPDEKEDACRQLKSVGTSKAIPALASLLNDSSVSLFARDALEVMPDPLAGKALRQALANTDGMNKVGVIDSLGERREPASVSPLSRLLWDKDKDVASAAATSLGKIGGKKAARALQKARRTAEEPVRGYIMEGSLLCADRFLIDGDKKRAAAIYKDLYKPDEKSLMRTAAYRGLVLSAKDPVAMALSALRGADEAATDAALQLASKIDQKSATMSFASALPDLPQPIQAALIDALAERNDTAASQAITNALSSSSETVRVSAIRALGVLGGPAAVRPLAEAAARSKGVEQRTAKTSLTRLRGKEIQEAILAEFLKAEPNALPYLAQALEDRKEKSAVPKLLNLATETDKGDIRLAAAQAMGGLADDSIISGFVVLLNRAESDKERAGIESALVSVVSRSAKKEACAGALLEGLPAAKAPARCGLLRVAGQAGGPEVLKALQKAILDEDESVRDAAVRTIADSTELDAAPDLLTLAREAKTLIHRVLAIRGYWRLMALAGNLPLEKRWEMCKAAMAASERPEEKRLGCAQLSSIPHIEALKLAETLCKHPDIRAEAEIACISIAAGVKEPHVNAAKETLRRLAKEAQDKITRESAQRMLAAMERKLEIEYISTWLVAGPYRKDGQQCGTLFDTVFPPEAPGSENVVWSLSPPPSDPENAWQVDLANVVAGNDCVVYLETNISVPESQKVRLDITSDDGVKVWINGQLVHANNAVRGMMRDQDKVETDLRQGSNKMLLKITQNVMGCGAAVRIRNTDGTLIKGLLCW